MSSIKALPGKLLRVTHVVHTGLERVRIVPNASILYVEAFKNRILIQYQYRHSETLIFPSVQEVNDQMKILEQHFSEAEATTTPRITDYPYPE